MLLQFDVPEEYGNLFRELVDDMVQKVLKETAWPQKGDAYYYVRHSGEVATGIFTGCGYDKEMMDFGNFFKTKEEAEFKKEQLIVLHELEKLANDNNEWDTYDYHYYIHYNIYAKQIEIGANYTYVNGNRAFYFDSAELAQAAIDKIGADRLIKYYFCIPEEK